MHFLRTCYALRSTPSDRWLSTLQATMFVLPVQIVPYTKLLPIPLITLRNMKSKINFTHADSIRFYVRTSSVDHVAAQHTQLGQYLTERHEVDVSNAITYTDIGYSGMNLDRPGLSQLRCDLSDKSWAVLVIDNFTRLSPDYKQIDVLVKEILGAGKFILSTNDVLLSPHDKHDYITSLVTDRVKNSS